MGIRFRNSRLQPIRVSWRREGATRMEVPRMPESAPVLVTCVRCLRLHVPLDLHAAHPRCPACRAKAARAAAAKGPSRLR